MVHMFFFIFLALYIFEALNGKPVGDGKPVKHSVSRSLLKVDIVFVIVRVHFFNMNSFFFLPGLNIHWRLSATFRAVLVLYLQS